MHRPEVTVVLLILFLALFFIPTFGSYTTLLIFESKMDPSEVDKSVRIFKQRRFKVQAYQVTAAANLEMVRFDICNETAKARNLVALVDYTEDREINNMLYAICQQIKLPYVMMSSSHQIRSNDNQYLLQLFPGAILQLLTLREYLDVEWKANRWKEGVIILSDNKADLDNYSTLIQGLDQYFLIRKWSKNEVDNFRMLKSVTDRSIKTFIVALEPKYLQSFFSLISSMRLITISNQFILSHMNAASADLNNFAYTGANITTFRVKVGQNNTLNNSLMTQLTIMARELLWAAITPLDALVSQSPAWRLRCTTKSGWPQGEQMMGNLVKTITSNYSFVKSEFVSSRLLNYSFDVLQLLTDGHHRRSTWMNNKGFYNAASKSEISEDLKFLIKNMTLRVVTIIDPPFVIYRDRDESGKIAHGNDRWTGLAMELLKRLSEIRSFKYKIHSVEDGNFGSLNDSTGKWTGMIGELIDNKADIAVASLTITYDRERVIDFTTPYMSLGLSIIIKKPKLKADLFQFMAPMSTDIWWLIILAYILVSFVLFILARMSPAEWYKQYPCSHSKVNQFSLLNSFWFTFGSIVQQGSDLCPKSPATRVAGAAWWFFVLIMVASYTANLAAFLTIDRLQSDITNVEELSRQSRVTYGSLFGGSTYSFFKNSEIPTYKRMWRAMSRRSESSESAFVNTNEKGIERVQNQDYAFILESTLNEYYRERNCDLMPLGGLIDSRGYGIGLPSGSLLRDSLSEAVLMLKKEQWVEKQRVKWLQHFNVSKPCSQKTTNNDAHRQRNRLNKQSVGGVFVCLLVGLAIALAVCVMETCLRAFRAKYKGKSSVSSYIHAQCRIACCTCSGEIHDPPPKDPMEDMEAPGPLLCSCRPLPPPDQMLKERHYLQNDVSLATVVSPGIPHHYNRNHHSNPNPWERERLLCSAVNRQLPDNRNGVWEPRQDLDVRKTPRFY